MASNTTAYSIHDKEKLIEQMDEIENERNLFLQEFIQYKQNLQEHSLMKQIDQWEKDSIIKIKQIAEECRQNLIKSVKKSFRQMDYKLSHLTEQLNQIRNRKKFNESDLNELKQKLIQLTEELHQPRNIFIEENSTLFINKINLIDRSSRKNIAI
jgi:chromosome segregation ATPase